MPHKSSDETVANLEIRFFQLQDTGYPVEFTLSGEWGQQEFPRGYLSADVLPWSPSADLAADGQRLLAALLADPGLSSAWAEARGQAARRRLCLRIDPAAAELHGLPWELLSEKDSFALLSAHADTPFSRYLPIALPWGSPVEDRPVRVLVAISNPDDLEAEHGLAPVDVAQEREGLVAALGGDEGVQLDFLDSPITLERLEEALHDGSYHVLHILSHGGFNPRRQQALLYLQEEQGHTALVPDEAVVGMLARQAVRPRLVFLLACQSAARSTADAFLGLGPKLVSVGVPAVVAMQDVVTMETGHTFSGTFYRRLVEHGQVDLAVNQARSTLLTAGRPDAAVPVLFMRLKSGQLWSEETDARGELLGSQNPRVFWTGLIRMIQQAKCTPIIGHRVYGRWIPQREDIARIWAKTHCYPFSDKDILTRVAQYMATSQGEDFPRYELLETAMQMFAARLPEELRPTGRYDTLTDLVRAVGWENLTADDPNDIHGVLASLDLPFYLTTNFGSFMTAALVAQGKQPVREICRWNDMLDGLHSIFEDDPNFEPTPQVPLVYHLFGNDEVVDSLVLTEDNYLDYLVQISAEMERIPPYVWAALANSSLMFLGYHLNDWEFRVILRGLVATRDQRRRFKHVAVQLEVDEGGETDTASVQRFLQQYFQDAEINVYWGSVQQFIAELREEWEATNR
ncbi:MAG TPA: CHAT domain-containing protein [Chloroflexi bacterium]|nr:CHAT domain-containing protein [Chloroflexota bacterium]